MRQNKTRRTAHRLSLITARKTAMRGSQRRRLQREMDPKAFTRAEAQRVIAASSNPEVIVRFAGHPNEHIKRYVAFKLDQLRGGHCAEVSRTVSLLIRFMHNGVTDQDRFKRRMASFRAAETRKQKKAEVTA